MLHITIDHDSVLLQVVQLLNGLKLHQGALLVLKERLDNLEDPLAVSNNRVYKVCSRRPVWWDAIL
jgi:hypothetical protein